VDPELADLVPIFVEEARDRLERLATLAPAVTEDADSVVEVKRELHTLKGAGRMLQLTPFAEICHGAEELLQSDRDDKVALLLRASDALNTMVDAVEAGEDPGDAADLIPLLFGDGGEPEPPPPVAAPEPAPTPAHGGGDVRIGADELGGPVAATVHATEIDGEGAPAPRPKGALHTGEIRVDATAIDRVADRATQIRIMSLASHRLSERVYDLARLAEEGVHEDKPTQVLAVLATMLRRVAVDLEGGQQRMSRAADEQLEGVLTLQVQPLKPFLLSLARHVRELAHSLGRQVEVEIEGADTRLDRRIVRELDESLIHLARNAVDHGLESPEERRRAGKDPSGTIRIQAGGQGSRVRLVLEDDGAGIDPHRVVEQAVRVGLVERNAARSMSPEQIYRLLFAPGFSTRTEVSRLSGRGVGLDVVAAAVIRVGGEVFLSSEPGKGTRVTLEVPLARRGEQVLLLRLGQARLAVPKAAVRRAVPLDKDKVLERDGRSLVEHDGRLVAFVPLSQVYGEPAAANQHLVLGDISGQPFALVVDEVEGEEEVLVRPVPRSAATDRYLDGVALLASGEPVGVLSPAALARRELLTARPRRRERAPIQTVRVLLVDDSLVTREMERRLLEDAGFDVTAAGDAEEALSALAGETFDCLVTDIEMPGMDGFELTEHLRGMEHFGELPIVVVSTRDRPEDRLRGLKAGADAYLTKQSLDAGELVDIVRRLSGS
jgi:two-component system, chemotaxis family, sensor kinase CheA